MARQLVAAMIAVVLAAALPAPVERHAAAQGYGGNANGERQGRGGRGGRRDRGPGGGRGGESERPAETRPEPPKPAAQTSTSFGTLSDDAKFAKSATDMIKSNDKNGDGILEGDELAKLGMSKRADADGDGKITQPELVTYYRGLSKPATTSTASSTATSSASKPSTSSATTPAAKDADTRKFVNTKRKSYRFKTTKERLPTWQFASRDANGDGQVSMSEYSRVWSDRTAAEFQRYDRNNDGMITAKEAR
jgi:Ca2+-binding EF-hand superfamily protein